MFKTPKFTQMPEPPMFKYENVQTEAEVEKPMNPNAYEDFKKAIEEAKNYADADVKDDASDAMMHDFRRRGQYVAQRHEKREKKHINKAVLNVAWTDFFGILVHNGYEVTVKAVGDEIEITWEDKVES